MIWLHVRICYFWERHINKKSYSEVWFSNSCLLNTTASVRRLNPSFTSEFQIATCHFYFALSVDGNWRPFLPFSTTKGAVMCKHFTSCMRSCRISMEFSGQIVTLNFLWNFIYESKHYMKFHAKISSEVPCEWASASVVVYHIVKF